MPRNDFLHHRTKMQKQQQASESEEPLLNLRSQKESSGMDSGMGDCDIYLDVQCEISLLDSLDIDSFEGINVVDYLDDILDTPEPSPVVMDEQVPGTSGLHSDAGAKEDGRDYPYFSDISDTDDEADEQRSNSGQSADFAYFKPEREIIETISINLITHKLYYSDDTVSERREHNFSVSPHFDTNALNWFEFCQGLLDEIKRHAEEQHRR